MLAADRRFPPPGSVFHELRAASVLSYRVFGRLVVDLFPHPALHRPRKNGASSHSASRGLQHLRDPTVRFFFLIPT